MNTRVKKLRKVLDLTQAEFATRIGVKRNTVATYEMGRSAPSDAALSLICREFHVNETWLRTGEGEMFQPEPRDVLDEMISQYGLPGEVRVIVEKFVELKPDAQQVVIEYVREVAAALNAESAAEPIDQQAIREAAAREKAEAYYQALLENAAAGGGIEAAEALYEKSLGIVPDRGPSALNTTGGVEFGDDLLA